MKRITFISAILILISSFALSAQISNKPSKNDEIIATVGINVPMYKGVESDLLTSLHYGHYYPNGVGFRIGVQYTPSVVDVDNYFGIPLALTFRTLPRSTSQKFISATDASFKSATTGHSDIVKYGFASFLMNVFDRLEFSAGLTPGHVVGESSAPSERSWGDGYSFWQRTWTEKEYDFALSVDLGMNISYSIWRFDIKMMPAFHYNLLNNFSIHTESGNKSTNEITYDTKPIRWFFTFSGGIAFRF